MALTYFDRTVGGVEQLWTTDGTVAGTKAVKSFGAGRITNFKAIGATAYFTVDDGVNGLEMWKSDGTASGTVLLLNINSGAADSFPSYLTNVDGVLYFSARQGDGFSTGTGTELWKSDGTTAGTVLAKDIVPGVAGSSPSILTNVNGTLFFKAPDPTGFYELWKSDGTNAGTVLIKDINPGAATSDPIHLTNGNGVLYFAADDGTNGNELWKSDGTTAGTVLIKDINPGVGGSIPLSAPENPLTMRNGVVFFAADDGSHGLELWKSDGTAGGTVLVKDINSGVGSALISQLININGTLFFSADDGTTGRELWKSDGTTAGTVLVKDIAIGRQSIPRNLTNVNGTLYFSADDGLNGSELWKSDGTEAGTQMVKDLVAGAGSSFPTSLAAANGLLEFYAQDSGTNANALFRTDGTSAGTLLLATNVPAADPVGVTQPASQNDLSGDGGGDILWRNDNTTLAVWTMGGATGTQIKTGNGIASSPGISWTIQGTGDFNGDSHSDILWRNSDTSLAVWTMGAPSGTQILTGNGIGSTPDASWQIQGIGDFNGDSRSDILWRNSNGSLAVWTMGGATGTQILSGSGIGSTPDSTWRIAGVGDFNGDGNSDILWRNNVSGVIAVWTMGGADGAKVLTGNAIGSVPDLNWHINGAGDFNGDGRTDILWRHNNGALAVWTMGGATGTQILSGNGIGSMPDATWRIENTADYNNDGKADILWRNNGGALAVWTMGGSTGTQILSGNGIGSAPDSTWHVQTHQFEVV